MSDLSQVARDLSAHADAMQARLSEVTASPLAMSWYVLTVQGLALVIDGTDVRTGNALTATTYTRLRAQRIAREAGIQNGNGIRAIVERYHDVLAREIVSTRETARVILQHLTASEA